MLREGYIFQCTLFYFNLFWANCCPIEIDGVSLFYKQLKISIMNKADRKRLEEAIELIQRAREIVEEIASVEQEKFDNLSEGLQATEKGYKLEEAASTLDCVNDELNTTIDSIQDAIEGNF